MIKNSAKFYKLDNTAFERVKDHLDWENPGNTLGSLLLDYIDFESGYCFTFLPDGVDSRKLHDFEYSILHTVKDKELRAAFDYRGILFELISLFLKMGKNHYSVFFDICQSNFLPSSKYGAERYVCIGHADIDNIKSLIREAEQYGFYGVFTKSDLIVPSSGSLSEEVLTEFAKNVYLIFVGGYDLESYIYWSNHELFQVLKKATLSGCSRSE